MTAFHDNFVWYTLMTTDSMAAENFYRGVLGWSARDSGVSDRTYTVLSAGEAPIGGVMTLPPSARAAGAKPVWSGYVAVDDVDAMVARVKQAGGTLHHGPEDIPGVGRIARVADPQGASFMLFKASSAAAPQRPAPDMPGSVGWRELNAGDGESAFAFYSGLFGWTKGEAIDMGSMGVYQIFAIGGVPRGGMMTKTEDAPTPFWLYYFNVDDIEFAVGRVKHEGGQILLEPHQVPGGSWITQCFDPQGAMFALVGPKRQSASAGAD